jgi:Fic family protein
MYIHEHKDWAAFAWDESLVTALLSEVRFMQGRLLGRIRDIGLTFELEIEHETIADEIIASSDIEGVALDAAKVRSSVARQLGLPLLEPAPDTRDVDGYVDIMFDAGKAFADPVTHERLFGWQAALFPSGYSGLHKIRVGQYRDTDMQVVSGAVGREKVHYTAPKPKLVMGLMDDFLDWLNSEDGPELLIKAGLAHLWFLTIHPFDDGNGRIARALTELLIARSDHSKRRFYSMARQILDTRKQYYDVLEQTQKGNRNVTIWLTWFLRSLGQSIERSEQGIQKVLDRSAFWHSLEGTPLNDRQRKMLGKLKDGFTGNLTSSKWAKICKVSDDTALRDINDLLDKGILVRGSAGGRSTSYLLSEHAGQEYK